MEQTKVIRYLFTYYSSSLPGNIYFLQVNNKSIWYMLKDIILVSSLLNLNIILNFCLVFLLLTLNIYLLAGFFMLLVQYFSLVV